VASTAANIARTPPAAAQIASVTIGRLRAVAAEVLNAALSATPEPCGTIAVNVE
jgi:hypothetical protein